MCPSVVISWPGFKAIHNGPTSAFVPAIFCLARTVDRSEYLYDHGPTPTAFDVHVAFAEQNPPGSRSEDCG